MKLPHIAIILATAAALTAPAPCAAQKPVTSFSQLRDRMKPGDKVWVTDGQGREIEGKIGSVTPETLTLEGPGAPVFTASDVRVVRRRDPGRRTVTGMAVGAIAGLGVGIAACAAVPEDDPLRGESCAFAIGLLWMPGLGAGYLIGAAFPGGKQDVYRSAWPESGAPPVRAFSQLSSQLKPGDWVVITDARGEEVEGRIGALQPDAISLDGRGGKTLAARDVLTVERFERDSLKNGTLIGLAVGGGLGALTCPDTYAHPEQHPGSRPAAVCAAAVAASAGAFALIGAVYDSATKKNQRLIYGAPELEPRTAAPPRVSIAPVVTPRTKGVAVSFAF